MVTETNFERCSREPIRQASLASSLGLENFMKMYMAKLEAHIRELQLRQERELVSSSESLVNNHQRMKSTSKIVKMDKERHISKKDNAQFKHSTVHVSSSLSRAAQIAQLKCYEEAVAEQLVEQDSDLAKELKRIQTPCLMKWLVQESHQVREDSFIIPLGLMDTLKHGQDRKGILDCVDGFNAWLESLG